MIATLDAGLAWAPYLTGDHGGVVLAAFRKAVYLRFDNDVVALVVGRVPPGPLHLRLSQLPLFKTGDVVEIHPEANGSIQLRSFAQLHSSAHSTRPKSTARNASIAKLSESQAEVECGDVVEFDRPRTWMPPTIDGARLRQVRPAFREAARSDLAGSPVIEVARQQLVHHDLAGAAAGLAGLGSGLTPAGDDVLAGILLVGALAGDGAANELVLVANEAQTHEISRAFLRWAALGQSIAPVHQLLAALTEQDHPLIERAQMAVAAMGSSSGADLLLGIEIALDAL